jgi:hypothetical protein
MTDASKLTAVKTMIFCQSFNGFLHLGGGPDGA